MIPPEFRPITLTDLPLLDILDDDCAAADGAPAVPETRFADLIGVAQCSMSDGRITSAGWAKTADSTAILRGKVHPAYRHQGIGRALLEHLERVAAEEEPVQQYVIRSETLTSENEAFYVRRGYACDFAELKMQRDLAKPLPNLPLADVELWSARNAPVFYAVYHESFSDRPGYRAIDPTEWVADHTDDETFRPDLSMLARWHGQPAGFITVFVDTDTPTEGYISQVGTPPFFRGRGIGAGLIAAVMAAMKDQDIESVWLNVNENNPRATGLYERLGFERVGRRGKFSRVVG